ncbi:MAG: COG2426 family protein [Spirochaetota bacterium]
MLPAIKKILPAAAVILAVSAVPVLSADEIRAKQVARDLEQKGVSPILATGLISMLPIFELRGSIPVGIAVFKQPPLQVYTTAVVFNLIPVLPILLLLNPVRKVLGKTRLFRGVFHFLDRKAHQNKKLVEKYQEYGLMLFVSIPLPVTGAWTGSLVAVLMGLNPAKSFLFISLGVFTAGVVVSLLTLLGMWGAAAAACILLVFLWVYIASILKTRKKHQVY